jgi:hypothetical protein
MHTSARPSQRLARGDDFGRWPQVATPDHPGQPALVAKSWPSNAKRSGATFR